MIYLLFAIIALFINVRPVCGMSSNSQLAKPSARTSEIQPVSNTTGAIMSQMASGPAQFIVHINNNNTPTINPQFSIAAQNESTLSSKPTLNNMNSQKTENSSPAGPPYRIFDIFHDFFINNKGRLTLWFTTGITIALWRHNSLAHATLNHPKAWGNWRKDMTLMQLQTLPQKQLLESLTYDIARRHFIAAEDIHNVHHAFERFFHEAYREQKTLRHLRNYTSFMRKVPVIGRFIASKTTIKKAARNTKRILFLRETVAAYLAQQTAENLINFVMHRFTTS